MCLAIPGKILSISKEDTLFLKGKVSFGGIVKEVNLSYVPECKIGEYVIVHAGFALSILNQNEADEVFTYLDDINYKDGTST